MVVVVVISVIFWGVVCFGLGYLWRLGGCGGAVAVWSWEPGSSGAPPAFVPGLGFGGVAALWGGV